MLSPGLRVGSALLCIIVVPAIGGCAHCRTGAGGTASAKCHRGQGGSAAYCESHRDSARGSRREAVAVSDRNGRQPQASTAGSRQGRLGRRHAEDSNRCSVCHRRGCEGGHERSTFSPPGAKRMMLASDLPRNANAGECFAQVYLPPEFETVTDRVLVKEPYEKVEVIPAEYEWTEERILVKEASTQLVAHAPQFAMENQEIELNPGHSTWMKADASECSANTAGPAPQDVFCLVSAPPTTMSLPRERLVRQGSVEEVPVPAEYQTVRKQKLVRAASTRRVTVPAEYREVERTVMLSPGRVEWQRVSCNAEAFEGDMRALPVRHNNR